MGMTNAERQKKWRERQKEKDREKYLQKERTRKRASYVSHGELSAKELKVRRQKCREKFRIYYNKMRAKRTNKDTAEPSTTSGMSTRSRAEKEILTVKLSLPKKTGVQKRYRRALRDAYRKLQFMKDKCQKLEKDKRKLLKRKERASRRNLGEDSLLADISSSPCDVQAVEPIQMTPRSKTKILLHKAGITFNRNNKVHRELFLGNVVIASLRDTIGRKKKVKSATAQISAEILKKYRCVYGLSKATGLCREKIATLNIRRARATLKKKYGKRVTEFLEREDNSVTQPGKRDTKTVDKEIQQKHVLNGYMHNLWDKFLLENPDIKLSRSQFCKLRPAHVLLTSFASRRTCLCTYHQNFSLKVKAMKKSGIQCTANPDAFLKEFESEASLQDRLEKELDSKQEITYKHWKKVQDGDKYRWKELEEHSSKEQFIETVLREFSAFRSHVSRVQNQYREMRSLRENLNAGEIVLWIDFAENYCCATLEEVQSAYWNSEMVSIHTMVAYLPKTCEKSKQSYVAVSGCLQHNAAAVYCILKKCIPLLKEECPDLKRIHYLSDSPTSQYRNKTIFQMLCRHQEEFGVFPSWHYLESGHGKGPCDGLGASVKRSADMNIKQGKCTIQNAEDFLQWAETMNKTSKVKYIAYTESDVKLAQEQISQDKPMAVAGTMKIHAVVPINESSIATRETSCNCDQCLEDVQTTQCKGWTVHCLSRKEKEIVTSAPTVACASTSKAEAAPPQDDTETVSIEMPDMDAHIDVNDWVAAVYENQWYVGQITETDTEDVQINFLEKAGKYGSAYRFPNVRDEIWVNRKNVLLPLKTLVAVGKTKRCFKLGENEQKQVEDRFSKYRLA